MITFNILMADICIRCEVNYEYSKNLCKAYLTDRAGDLSVSVSFDDIYAEAERYDKYESRQRARSYYESLALYRKICSELALRDRILIHGSSLMLDGEGFLFCAPSGTGKSTHTRLWREVYGDKVVMINDDKPLVWMRPDGSAHIYGTPWNGKHHIGSNISAPLKNICFLERGDRNELKPADKKDAQTRILRFTFRPDGPLETAAMLATAEKITGAVKLWNLKCNMDPEAAVVSCEGMTAE
jgi:hypothetical protein